jgi:glycosyltransferase involved in cell wall biosynthesis
MSLEFPVSISVVVPVYSGEAFLAKLINQLDLIRKEWGEREMPAEISEVILVDDAGVDNSPTIVDHLAATYSWVTAIHLMQNFGQHAATIAGVLHTSGDWVITMDEDLQHPPSEIETLLRKAVETGSDIVYANPVSAVHQSRSRDWASRGFKNLMVVLTGNPYVIYFNSFRLLRGSMARAASSVCGHETFFDVALSWFSKRVSISLIELKDHRYIKSGVSGYTFRRLLSHARRLLISSQVKVIRVFGLIGMVVVGITILAGFAIIFEKIASPHAIPITGWASLMLAILFFGGFVSFMVALALEYLSNLMLSAQGKPVFFTVDRSNDALIADFFRSELK